MRRIKLAVLAVALLSLPACAGGESIPLTSPTSPVALPQGPAIERIDQGQQQARACIAGLSGARNLRLGIGPIEDRTGKISISIDGGTGNFVPQSGTEMAIAAARGTGIRLVEVGGAHRALVDWFEAKKQSKLAGDGATIKTPVAIDGVVAEQQLGFMAPRAGTVGVPMAVVYGAITHLDFLPGGGFELRVGGVGPSYRAHRILVGLDLRAVTMPYRDQLGGEIIATASLMKQVVAVEMEVGVASFFGTNDYFSFRMGEQQREALQFALRAMIERATLELISQLLDPRAEHDCARHFNTSTVTSVPAS